MPRDSQSPAETLLYICSFYFIISHILDLLFDYMLGSIATFTAFFCQLKLKNKENK